MALAKYYEDIVERLLEENESLRRQLWIEVRTANPNPAHMDAHLNAAKNVLDELLDVLTSPDVASMFDEAAFARLKKEHEELHVIAGGLRSNLTKRDEVIASLNSENNQLNRKVMKLSADLKALEKASKKRH